MPRYTVRHSESGKQITFDWSGSAPPTDADLEEIFVTASSPEKRQPTPEPRFDPELAKEAGVERTKRFMATAEQYGIPLSDVEKLEKPETLGQRLALYSARPEEAAKLAMGSWPLPVGEGMKAIREAARGIRTSAAARAYVPKSEGALAKVLEDLQIVPPSKPIPTRAVHPPTRAYEEAPQIIGEAPAPKGEIAEEFAKMRADVALKTPGHLREAEDLLALREMKPTWIEVPPKGVRGEAEYIKEPGFQGWETLHPEEVRPALETAIRDLSNGKVYATHTKTPHALLAQKLNETNGVAWENMKSGFVTPGGKFLSEPGELRLLKELENLPKSGGFSLRPEGSPTEGFMVGGAKKGEVIPAKEYTPEKALPFFEKHSADVQGNPRLYNGAWESKGKFYLDISENVDDLEKALKLGAKRGEKEVWDVAAGKGIPVPASAKAKELGILGHENLTEPELEAMVGRLEKLKSQAGGQVEVGYHYSGKPRTELRGSQIPSETQRYSGEIRARMEAAVDHPEWPFIPEVSVYGPGAKPEAMIAGGRIRHKVQYETGDLYDLNKDPSGIMGKAGRVVASSTNPFVPGFKRNVVANLIQKGGYKGFIAGENRYLFGEVPAQVGRVVPGLVPHMATTATGAVVGGALDEDNRLRGAVIGGLTGFTVGLAATRAMMPKGQGLPKGSRLVKGGNVEIPPVKEGPLTEPSLRYPPHKAVSTQATEQMIEKGIKRDPTKLMSQQIMDEISATPEKFVEILRGYDVTPQQFASFLGVEAKAWGRKLGLLGNLSRRMHEAGIPELAGELGQATGWDHFQFWWRRVDNVRRALLVTQLSTAMRNLETQMGRVGLNVFEQALNSGLQKLWGAAGGQVKAGVGVLDGAEPVLRLFQSNKQVVSRILKALPGGEDRLVGNYMADISTGARSAKYWGPVQKGVDIINGFNRFQEFVTRRAVFMGKLDQRLAQKSLDLKEVIKNNRLGAIEQEDIRYALNEALEFTFAKQPQWGSVGQKFVSFINALPGATWVMPFPRFMVNALKFNFEYSPLGLLKLLSPAERSAFKNGNMQVVSRAILGSALLGAAWQFRNSEHAGEKWYEAKLPSGEIMDLRPYNPFAAYLFVADVAKKMKDNEFYKMTWQDAVMGIAGTNLRAGVGLWMVDKTLAGFSEFADEHRWEQAKAQMMQVPGELLGGLLTPLNQIKEFLYGFDDYIVKERKSEPLLGPAKARIPGVEAGLPAAYKPTREEPIKMKWPIVRQTTGFAFGPPKNPLEKELDRLGFDRREILAPMGDPAFDNLVSQKMGYIAGNYIAPLMEEDWYKSLSDGEKGIMLSEVLADARKDAREWAASEQPEVFKKLQLARQPKRERLLMKEMGIVQ